MMTETKMLCKDSTTAIKGIAILLIVICHVGQFGFHIRMFVPLGGIGVAVFLILSGFGLMESYTKYGLKDFWKKRVLRLLIPYFIWCAAYCSYLMISNKTLDLDEIRYWFIEYIIIWYLIFISHYDIFTNIDGHASWQQQY